MIRAVIFDFNGILVDDEPVHFALLREVLAEEGVEITERQYHEEYLGYDDRGCLELALARAGRPAQRTRVEDLIARKAGRYAAWAEAGLRYFPGAAESIAALADRWPVAICSGALRPEIECALRRLGVLDRIAAIVSSEDTARSKPDPEGYLLTLDALDDEFEGLEAGHCLVVEDSLAGIQSAKAAGMWAVGVTHTYTAEELRAAGADAVATALGEITPMWVERLFTPEISP